MLEIRYPNKSNRRKILNGIINNTLNGNIKWCSTGPNKEICFTMYDTLAIQVYRNKKKPGGKLSVVCMKNSHRGNSCSYEYKLPGSHKLINKLYE